MDAGEAFPPPRQRFPPLACLLVALVAGAIGASLAPAPPGLALGAACLGALAAWLWADRPARWALCFLAAATAAAWAHATLRRPAALDPAERRLPPRALAMEVAVERLFGGEDRYGRRSGIGKVVEAPGVGPVAAGDRVFFQTGSSAGDASLARRSTFRATGILRPIDPDEGAGFERYLLRSGARFTWERLHDLRQARPPPAFQNILNTVHENLLATLRHGAPEAGGHEAIYGAMLLGRRGDLGPEQEQRFAASGTMHFFAVSGLHIGVIAAVLAQALRLARVPFRLTPWIALPILYFYVEVIGAPPSATRAFFMTAFFWAAYAVSRQRSPLAAWTAAAVAMLAVDPANLWRPGFQLSYLVVASILLYGLPLYESARTRLAPFRDLPESDLGPARRAWRASVDRAWLLAAIGASAWLASAPLIALHFDIVSVGAIALNIALIYLASLVIVTGVLAMALGMLALAPAAAFLNHAAWTLIAAMGGVIELGLRLPLTPIRLEGFSPAWAYGGALGFAGLLFALRCGPPSRATSGPLGHAMPPLLCLLALLGGAASGG